MWSRLEPFDPHELGRMLTDREAVRMTLMRGTVHLVRRSARSELSPAERDAVGAEAERMVELSEPEAADRGVRFEAPVP